MVRKLTDLWLHIEVPYFNVSRYRTTNIGKTVLDCRLGLKRLTQDIPTGIKIFINCLVCDILVTFDMK